MAVVEDFSASEMIIAASSALLRERRWELSWDVFWKHWASDAIVGMGGAACEEEGEDAMSTRLCWVVLRGDGAVGAEAEVATGPVSGGEERGSTASAIVL